MPTDDCMRVWKQLMRLYRQIRAEEESKRLDLTREPDPGFARRAFEWTNGKPLERVLEEDDAPGDFVRSVKQLVDLLRQMTAIVPPGDTSDRIVEAVEGLNRGVIAYTSLEL
jgi:ATP-dependent RNA helicase HelY